MIEPNTRICSTSGAFCPLNLWFDPQWQVWGSGQVRRCPTDASLRTCEQRCSTRLILRELVSQDQMRIVKTRLLEMLPHARIFLGLLPSDRRPSARALAARLRIDMRFATLVCQTWTT